jgi:hypothetical protein
VKRCERAAGRNLEYRAAAMRSVQVRGPIKIPVGALNQSGNSLTAVASALEVVQSGERAARRDFEDDAGAARAAPARGP